MRRAQSTLEYTVVIACIVAALLAMRVYIKRGMQGRLRQAADELGQQYAPGNTTSYTILIYSSDTETKVETNKINDTATNKEIIKTTSTTTINREEQTRQGTETVGDLESSLF